MKHDLLIRNPLRQLGLETEEILSEGGFGAVLARAGLGKTAFTVQIALHAMLRGRHVLHISLDDPVDKVSLWYREAFQRLSAQHQTKLAGSLWEELLRHRFIMTFKVEGFSVPKLRERLTDLTQQQIFQPHVMIVDGLPFDPNIGGALGELKTLSREMALRSWFTVRTHRHEAPGASGFPPQLESCHELFEVALQLLPEGDKIHILQLKGGPGTPRNTPLRFDPATMLISEG